MTVFQFSAGAFYTQDDLSRARETAIPSNPSADREKCENLPTGREIAPTTMFLLGALATVLCGIAANLLTPFAKPLWEALVSLQRRSARAQARAETVPKHADLLRGGWRR